MRSIAENLWTLRYPLPVLGSHFGRNVTLIRLRSGKVVIHSTGKFSREDVEAIRRLGEPGWLVDASRFHDTLKAEGRAAFPHVPYLVPPGFDDGRRLKSQPLLPAPPEWSGELEIVRLGGMPWVEEHVFFHVPSRSLIVCDLVFNFGARRSGWIYHLARPLMGLRDGVGMSFFFRLSVRNRAAFLASLAEVLRWDFQRIIVGHGEPLEGADRQTLRAAAARRGLRVPGGT